MSRIRFRLAALALCGLSVCAARADMFGFERTTAGSAVDVGPQLSLTVREFGERTVSFRFENQGEIASSISEIAIGGAGDRLLGRVLSLTGSGDGVHYQYKPAVHGAGSNGDFQVGDADFLLRARNPLRGHGIDPSEWVEVNFSLRSGTSFGDVLGALNRGGLWMQLEVVDIGPELGNDSFLNGPRMVPAPGAAVLALLGMPFLNRFRRRV